MYVEDGLAGFAVRVEQSAKPALVITPVFGQCRRSSDHFTNQSIPIGAEIVQRRDVGLGDNQKVQWRLRVDVLDDDELFIFVDDFRGDSAGGNPTEQTFIHSILWQITVRGMS